MAKGYAKRQDAADVSTELTAKYFRTLGEPTRLRMLEMLLEGPLTVTDLTHVLRCPQSTVSNHLACLRWCGLVTSESRGKWVYYSVADRNIRKVIELGKLLVSANAERVAACTRIGD
ncbi:MAG: metalloregulator ArsR/SmtB family transcription factor [Candidatus Velthaea sp.]